MTESIARQPQGIPVGGQFAATSHSEPALTLPPHVSATHTADYSGQLELNTYTFDELPTWPEDLPEPSVEFDFDDGKVQTRITVDDKTMHFWNSDLDGTMNSTDYGEDPWEDFDLEDNEVAMAWGKAVHERIDSNTYGAMLDVVHQPQVSEAIMAHALGKPSTSQPAPAQPLDLTDDTVRASYEAPLRKQIEELRLKEQRSLLIGCAKNIRDESPQIQSFEIRRDYADCIELTDVRDKDGNLVDGAAIRMAQFRIARDVYFDDMDLVAKDGRIDIDEAMAWRP
ncbi:hypothetical protein [Arthrobacter sp. HLT1-21]